jgi:hypothetical protein
MVLGGEHGYLCVISPFQLTMEEEFFSNKHRNYNKEFHVKHASITMVFLIFVESLFDSNTSTFTHFYNFVK